ncbi:MAG: DUF648 domain-containing protein [Parachlamydiaceae bacterium]
MSARIGFFTAVEYEKGPKSFSTRLLETVDDYFYLGGKKAFVIQGKSKKGHEKALLSDAHSSLLARIAKVLSYFTLVLPVSLLALKAVLRSKHSFRQIDPKKWLEKGISIKPETIAKIQSLMPKIVAKQDDQEIIWLSKYNFLVFKLTEDPNVIFKIAPPWVSPFKDGRIIDPKERTDTRFSNMVKAKEVILANQLGQLIVPHAKKIEIKASDKTYTLIAEECLDFDADVSTHITRYQTPSKALDETVRQLAVFIAKTGFNDVTWRNIPFLNEKPDAQGNRRVALIDLEDMDRDSVDKGFTGDVNESCGLIGCLSKDQIDIAINEAKKQGISGDFEYAKGKRLKEIEYENRLQKYYEDKNIKTGKEPLEVDLASLGLDLNEETQTNVTILTPEGKFGWVEKTISMKQVAEALIAEINKQLKNGPKTGLVSQKRSISLYSGCDMLVEYGKLGLPEGKLFYDKNGEDRLWIRRIIKALIDKGYLFDLEDLGGYGYRIQA